MFVTLLSVLLVSYPDKSRTLISTVRDFFVNDLGVYYILVGLFFVGVLVYLGVSKYGKIKLGSKVEYSNFSWGAMIFTSTMAADILFYSLHEWMYYYTSMPLDYGELSIEQKQLWASTYPLFHWGAIPWAFYLVPAVAYAFMFYVRGRSSHPTISEACRPVLGNRVDGKLGRTIDVIAIIGLLLGTSTTFSAATPLCASALSRVIGLSNSTMLTIGILLVIAAIYTLATIGGMKAIDILSKVCVSSFIALASIFIISGSPRYIIETGVTGLGNMVNNFLRMSTWMDPLRASAGEGVQVGTGVLGFTQSWTVFYWAYWIAWAIATPLFIAKISKGRTVRNVVFGGMTAGLLGTFTSFIVFGNYGLEHEVTNRIHVADLVASGSISASDAIIEIFGTLKFPTVALILLALTMIGLYATTLDSISHVMSSYCYKKIGLNDAPSRTMRIFWSVLFIVLPISLVFINCDMSQLQAMSIIAAFPVSIILLLVVISFLRDARTRNVKDSDL